MAEQLSHVPLEEGNGVGTQIKPLLRGSSLLGAPEHFLPCCRRRIMA